MSAVVPDELRSALIALEPTARLVPLRALRRAIRLCREQTGLPPHAVHDRCFRISRDQLFQLLTPGELDLSPEETASELLLIPAPEVDVTGQTWNDLWRTLFHAAVDREFDQAVSSGRLDHVLVRDARRSLGPAKWRAIRMVVEEENLIDDRDPDTAVIREFAACALELIHFSPGEWETYFPSIQPTEEPLRSVRSAIDSGQIYERTRPQAILSQTFVSEFPAPLAPVPPREMSEGRRARIVEWSKRGNDVRTAVELYQSGDAAASEYLDRLLHRLGTVLDLTSDELREWERAFRPVLPRAAAGGWPVERRLLYELQRACLAVERQTYSADLVEWAMSLGRRPIKRPLPKTTWVEATRRLRAAWQYAERLAETFSAARHLVELTESAARQTEQKARDDLRPEIVAVLDEVGLAPGSVAERISRDKVVEELLDAACDRGFLRIGDLRDAIARNRVKLRDLSGAGELVRGDPLILANRKLPQRLDGVYRRGEIYMRLLQRGCSIFFGTRPGRLLTRYVALPFGGAFILIEAVNHMVEAAEGFIDWLTGWRGTVHGMTALGGGPAGTLAANPTLESKGVTWTSLLFVGVFLFLMLHWPLFRGLVARGAKFVFIKLPRAIHRSPTLRILADNAVIRFFRRHLLIPLASGALAALGMKVLTEDGIASAMVGTGVALLSATFFRTPFGRETEDRLNETVARLWRVVSVNFVVGLLTFVLQLFRALFAAIDRGIHAVDEWLRFREGEGRAAFAVKVSVGAVWFVFTYLFRFAWTLLVEPQVNPIKHFPVVTVSHKLLLPLIPSLAKQFGVPAETMGTIVFGIPGIFGFLVWELRENWKLYRANAPDTVRPSVVGSHGENVRGLLRPGFHSGTVPKTFTKLRRAVRTGRIHRAAKQRHALAHVAEAVHRFVDRDVIACLQASRRWGGIAIRVGHIQLTPNRILIPFAMDDSPTTTIAIEELGGWVVASVAEPGWLAEIGDVTRAAFTDALVGLYNRAGVHAVREQAAAVFGGPGRNFDAVPEGLIIPQSDGRELFFDYDDGPELTAPDRRLPSDEMVLSCRPLRWADWVERWEADAAGKSVHDPLIPGWHFLPPTGSV